MKESMALHDVTFLRKAGRKNPCGNVDIIETDDYLCKPNTLSNLI